MGLHPIATLDELKAYLATAIQLEHATIPPYMMALYSIVGGTNLDARQVLRVVLVEEMLHLTLAANILNAVGGRPDLTVEGFVPRYPTPLPDGETDFTVSLQGFSHEAIEGFLKIERPARADSPEQRRIRRKRADDSQLCRIPGHDNDLHFYSIGEFYGEIERGLNALEDAARARGETIFTGDVERQVGPAYYYSGGGEITVVEDLASAQKAIDLIQGQGEGHGGGIYDEEGEISHYYRFQQLVLGRYYQPGDAPDEPTGGPVDVDWDAVYPIKTNIRRSDLPKGSDLLAAAEAYDAAYATFLGQLTEAFDGHPERLLEAVGGMFHVKEAALALIRNPLPGQPGVNAAPTYQIDSPSGGCDS